MCCRIALLYDECATPAVLSASSDEETKKERIKVKVDQLTVHRNDDASFLKPGIPTCLVRQ